MVGAVVEAVAVVVLIRSLAAGAIGFGPVGIAAGRCDADHAGAGEVGVVDVRCARAGGAVGPGCGLDPIDEEAADVLDDVACRFDHFDHGADGDGQLGGIGDRVAIDGERAGADVGVALVGVRAGEAEGAGAGFGQAAGAGNDAGEGRAGVILAAGGESGGAEQHLAGGVGSGKGADGVVEAVEIEFRLRVVGQDEVRVR